MDKSKLIKLLNLTSSSNEDEAVSAMRKANSLLEESQLNWEKILKETPEIKRSDKFDYAMTVRDLKIERNISRELRDEIKFSKMILKFLVFTIIVLIIIIIFK